MVRKLRKWVYFDPSIKYRLLSVTNSVTRVRAYRTGLRSRVVQDHEAIRLVVAAH
jgi:hypothetical protein